MALLLCFDLGPNRWIYRMNDCLFDRLIDWLNDRTRANEREKEWMNKWTSDWMVEWMNDWLVFDWIIAWLGGSLRESDYLKYDARSRIDWAAGNTIDVLLDVEVCSWMIDWLVQNGLILDGWLLSDDWLILVLIGSGWLIDRFHWLFLDVWIWLVDWMVGFIDYLILDDLFWLIDIVSGTSFVWRSMEHCQGGRREKFRWVSTSRGPSLLSSSICFFSFLFSSALIAFCFFLHSVPVSPFPPSFNTNNSEASWSTTTTTPGAAASWRDFQRSKREGRKRENPRFAAFWLSFRRKCCVHTHSFDAVVSIGS